ncbi:MAG: phosphatase PAP2 family protein [Alphaproteobacteria bacterium]|nr:phosphatase PAP2 family protein [Alphaproteobacteria bacterium]
MRVSKRVRACLAAGLVLSGIGFVLAATAKDTVQGYLSADQMPDALQIVPPAPVPGSARYESDRAIFRKTRAFKDSPRWNLAADDDRYSNAAMAAKFACALGGDLAPPKAPRFWKMIDRATVDVVAAARTVKAHYKRERPFLVDDGDICIARSDSLDSSPDYPSGHATVSWMLGLILAELAPDRATHILARARAYGESRIVCGVHNESAIDAGRMEASAIVAVLHGSAQFQADMKAARTEMADVRKHHTRPASCAAEEALVAEPLE